MSTLYALRFVRNTELQKLFSFNVTPEVLAELQAVSDRILDRTLNRELRSKALLTVLTT